MMTTDDRRTTTAALTAIPLMTSLTAAGLATVPAMAAPTAAGPAMAGAGDRGGCRAVRRPLPARR